MKLYIRGFAESRKEIERSLSDHTGEIVEHLIKLVLLPNNSARNHWQGEIAGQLKSVRRFKNSNKFPTAKQIYNWTYDKVQDLVTDCGWMQVSIQDVSEQYNVAIDEDVNVICQKIDAVCVEYFKWLADKLSTVGKVATSEIYNKLDELV